MNSQKGKNKTLIRKGIKYYTFFVITFFLSISTAFAYDFKYSEFNWDDFYEQRKTFWEDLCRREDGGVDNECEFTVLKSQEKFYKKFYKALAKYEKKGFLSLVLRNMNILMILF